MDTVWKADTDRQTDGRTDRPVLLLVSLETGRLAVMDDFLLTEEEEEEEPVSIPPLIPVFFFLLISSFQRFRQVARQQENFVSET